MDGIEMRYLHKKDGTKVLQFIHYRPVIVKLDEGVESAWIDVVHVNEYDLE